MEIKKFSDFAKNQVIDGEKIKLDDILNIDIIITAYRVNNSKFKQEKYLQLQFELDNIRHVLFTGSSVLIKQIEEYESNIPFLVKIIKIKNYYTFA
mgnify:CR=1 FL=1